MANYGDAPLNDFERQFDRFRRTIRLVALVLKRDSKKMTSTSPVEVVRGGIRVRLLRTLIFRREDRH